MKLTKRQGYTAAYYFLDKCWNEIQPDDLDKLLGAMSPFIFKDTISADSAYWEDWLRCSYQVTSSDTLVIDKVFQVMLLFLEFYQDEFKFELNELFAYLDVDNYYKLNWHLKDKWVESLEQAMR